MASKKAQKNTPQTRKVGDVVLEKGVEIPEGTRKARSPYTQAIRAMGIDESFVAPADKAKSIRATLSHEKRNRDDFNYHTWMTDNGLRVKRVPVSE